MKSSILRHLKEAQAPLKVKKLKKLVLSEDGNEGEEDKYVKVLTNLKEKGKIQEVDDHLSLVKDNKKRQRTDGPDGEEVDSGDAQTTATKEEKEKKQKKKSKGGERNEEADVNGPTLQYPELWRDGERMWREGLFSDEYLRKNPDKVTRLFCGNLNKNVTEEALKDFIPNIVYIKWQVDKTTRQFYGSSFLEMKDPAAAAIAVSFDKSKFMGRPLKLYYCPPRPGDVWPPSSSSSSKGDRDFGSDAAKANGGKRNNPLLDRPKTPRPPNCKKLYCGNLSYSIDDETIMDFFKDCGTMVGLRWLVREGTDEFRGSGFVEFSRPEEAEEAFKLDGKELLGRPIRLDWTL